MFAPLLGEEDVVCLLVLLVTFDTLLLLVAPCAEVLFTDDMINGTGILL